MWREAVDPDDLPDSGGVSVLVDGERVATSVMETRYTP